MSTESNKTTPAPPSTSSAFPEAANGRKVVIKSADMDPDVQKQAIAIAIAIKNTEMNPEVQREAIDVALDAFEKFNVEKDVAEDIKKQFDKKYGPTWHCIVGKNFGSYVTHETNHFVYFYLDVKAILLFKSG